MTITASGPIIVPETDECIAIARTCIQEVRTSLDMIDMLDRPADRGVDGHNLSWTCRNDGRRQLTVSWTLVSPIMDYTRIVSFHADGIVCEIRIHGGFPEIRKVEDWLQTVMDGAWDMLSSDGTSREVPAVVDAVVASAMNRSGAGSAMLELASPWKPAVMHSVMAPDRYRDENGEEARADLSLLPRGMTLHAKRERRNQGERLDCGLETVQRLLERPGPVETLRLLALLDETRRAAA